MSDNYYASPDLSLVLANCLSQVEAAIDAKAEAETITRVQQITSLSAGSIVTTDEQRNAIKEKAAAEYAQEFADQVKSVATVFRTKLAG